MSAAKKNNAVSSVLTVGAVLVGVYLVYRLLFAPKAATTSSGIVGGGYGGGYNPYSPYSPYGTTGTPTQSMNPLSALLASLLGQKQPQASKGGGSIGSGGGGSSAGSGGGAAVNGRQQLQTLADFVNAANYDYYKNGGADAAYASSDVAGLFTPQIEEPGYTPQTLDVSQFAQNFNPFADSTGDLTDAFASSDVAGLFAPQIEDPDYTPQTLDVSQFAQDFNPFGGGGDAQVNELDYADVGGDYADGF